MAAQQKPRKPTPKQGAKTAEIEIRRAQAMRLRLRGMTYRAIAAELGVNEKTAFGDVAAVLERTREEANEDAGRAIAMEVERLDALIASAWPSVESGDTAAIETARRLGESRRKLLGLDAPTRQEVTGKDGKPIGLADPSAVAASILGTLAGLAPKRDTAGDPGKPSGDGNSSASSLLAILGTNKTA